MFASEILLKVWRKHSSISRVTRLGLSQEVVSAAFAHRTHTSTGETLVRATNDTMLNPPAFSGISSYYNTDSWLALVSEHIESLSKSLRVLSLDIHDHPEIRNKEFHAHEILTRFIKEQKSQDWVVTPSAYGIATAFVAVFDSGRKGPVVSVNAEYGELGIFFNHDLPVDEASP